MALLKKRPRKYSHPDEPVKKDKKEREKWLLMEMIPDGPEYTAYQRLDALTAYMTTGSVKETEKLVNIPYQTIYHWVKRSTWFPAALRELRIQKDDELDSRITGMIDKVTDAMLDRLEKGDVKVTKDGEHIRVPVSFRDLAIAGLGITYDKRALIRGNPTQRIEHVNEDERLKKLAKLFQDIQSPKTIEGEVLSNDNELKDD